MPEVVVLCARHGCKVPLLARGRAGREVEGLGGEALAIPTDVADYGAVERAADNGAHGRFGDQSRTKSPLLWASENRGWIAAGAALAVGAGFVTARLGGGGEKK
jgi:hypothetical protein